MVASLAQFARANGTIPRMTTQTWLIACAAELDRLFMAGPRCGEDDVPAEGWGFLTAYELANDTRYSALQPEAAAQAFWRDIE